MTASRTGVLRAFGARASRWLRHAPWFVAFVLWVVLLPTTIHVFTDQHGMQAGVASGLAIAQTAPLMLAPVRPLQAWCVILAADVVGALVLLAIGAATGSPWPFPPMQIVGFVALCLALGLRESRWMLVRVWVVTAVANVGLLLIGPRDQGGGGFLLSILGGVALVLGAVLRERSEAQRRLAEQETISEVERGRRTLLEERARIARELHDVVAHHMSVITVQASSAPYRLDDLPPGAREEFDSIAEGARASLSEMRRLLGVLRNEQTDSELVPQPDLAQIAELVEATTRAGVDVSLRLDEVDVPATIGLTVYRIVQESLANVVRHAPGSSAAVSILRDGEELRVLVTNGPPLDPVAVPLEPAGTGHGLIGMRERVRLVAGELEAGPLPDSGYRVAARLPLEKGPPP